MYTHQSALSIAEKNIFLKLLTGSMSTHMVMMLAHMYTHTKIAARHRSILTFIASFQEQNRSTPSYEEIAERIGVSKACVAVDLRRMVKAGVLQRPHGSRRRITIAVPVEKKTKSRAA
jgi:DNA-binding MarR family transcriptional regulator